MNDSSELWRHLAGMLMVVSLLAVYSRIGRFGPLWQILFRLPGTLLHESAHFAAGLLTGGRPSGFTVFPRRKGDGLAGEWVLGSVTLRKPGALSALPTGLAPLLLLVGAWFAFSHWFQWFSRDLPHTLSLYGTVCVLVSGSIPSRHDLRVAFSSLAGVAIYSSLAAALVLWW